MKTQINIDKLILHGFSKREAFYIRQEVRRSLTRLIEIRGLSGQKISGVQNFSAPEIRIKPSSRPETTGRQIAKSIYQGLNKPPTHPSK